MHIKNLLERSCLFIAIVSTLVVAVLSLMSMEGVPNLTYPYTDKFEHSFAYAFLSFFWLLSCQIRKIKTTFLILILCLVLFGVIIEVLQSNMSNHRTGDFLDVIANTIGILIGYFVLKILNRLYLQV